jgi:hypothetical protein
MDAGPKIKLATFIMEAGALTTHLLAALHPVARVLFVYICWRNFDLDTTVASLTSNDLFIWKLFLLAT